MIAIHGMADSGNCYKPRLLMALTGRPFRHVETSSRDGSTHTPEFLALNPVGKVPILVLDDGRTLSESNAILAFLGEETPFVPADPFGRALMLQWMFFEQYSHEPYVAVRRSLVRYPERASRATPERMAETLAGGEKALGVMEEQLSKSTFLVGENATLADVALYAYTHDAQAGGFDLGSFPGVGAWLRRVEALPGFRPMQWLPS